MGKVQEVSNGITEGVIWKQILIFFFPIFFGTLFMTLYNTVDAVIVGQFLGKEALAAVSGGTSTLTNLIIGFFNGMASGATVVISQFYGAKDEDKVKKIENSKLFQNPKKIEMIMLILFLLPGTPKDLLVYIAGLLPIKPSRFILISTFARFPSVISSTLAGANIAVGDWKLGIILYAIIVIAVAILAFIYQKFDKEKITSEALKTIK